MTQKKSSGLVPVRPDPKEFRGQRRSGLWTGWTEHGIGALVIWDHGTPPEGAQSTAEVSHLKTIACNCQENHAGWAAMANEEH